MRKLYTLLAGFVIAVMTMPANARTLTPDIANFTFTIDATTGNVAFTNTSVLGNEPGTRRAFWSFGDGSGQWTGALDGTQHHYQSAGTYTVCLSIYRIGSNTSDSVLSAQICKTLVIESICQANFETVATSANTLGKYFVAIPSHSQNKKPLRICWIFGDNHDTCIQYSTSYTGAYSVYHLYSQPGAYNVCVNILYDGGCQAQNCHTIQTGDPDSCRANFETVATTTTPLGKYFVAQPWNNHNKKPVRICWTFGDSRDTCIQYTASYTGAYGVYHQYSQPGSYNVCVNILYDGGCQAQNCHDVQIGDAADSCRADFERIPVTTSDNPRQAAFRALPWHNHDKKPVYICWTFGDNQDTCIQYSNTYPGPYTVNHTYANAGNYEVCVRIVYSGGCEARKCRVIEINTPDSCRADFERISAAGTNNTLLTYFRALPWHSSNKKPSRICWTFGDNTDTCINYGLDYNGAYAVSHTYQHPGQYEVCVKILYVGGCEARKCRVIEVNSPDSCRADFERIPVTTANDVLSASFRAIPWHNNNKKPSRICWTFGDNTDTCINYGQDYNGPYVINHRYSQPGQYEVCVKTLYYGGCEARKCNQVIVPYTTCSVTLFELTPSINSLTRILYAIPHSLLNRPVERICWNFGDGSDTCIMATSSTPPPLSIQHTYPAPGVYRTCVRILFQGGCIAEKCVEVVIRGGSHQCGGYMTDSLIAPHTFKFKAFAIHAPNDPVVSYRWSFGDGTTATGQEVTHTYNAGGEYRVCLTINTQSGCETRICNTVRIPGTSQAILQLSPNPVINILHALFFSNRNETVAINIVNSAGVVVRTYTRNVTAGANNWDFDLSNLLPGTYLFTVQSPNQSASAIFIKQQ